jgi:hypothetical protein
LRNHRVVIGEEDLGIRCVAWQGKGLGVVICECHIVEANLFAGLCPAWYLQFTEENGHRSHPLSLSIFRRLLSLVGGSGLGKEKGPLNPFRI